MVRSLLGTTALAAGLFLAAGTANAQVLVRDYSRIVAFGDSLSDTGNLPPGARAPAPIYFNGRFSNGPVWVEHLGTLSSVPVTSVALGGARSGQRTDPAIDLQTQVTGYLAANPSLRADALYSVWIGGNDYLNFPGGDAVAYAGGVVANTVGAANRLIQAGARNVLIFNLPNLGDIPGGRAGGAAASAQANQISGVHNGLLETAVNTLRAQTGANVIFVDINRSFADILANPSAYGIANTTVPCFTGTALTGACATQAGADGTLFFDPIHPTTVGHRLTAQFVSGTISAMLDAPAALAGATQFGLRLLDSVNQGVFSRMAGARTGTGDVGVMGASAQGGADGRTGLFLFGNYIDGDQDRLDGQLAFDYDGYTFGIGADYQVDEHLVAGLAFAYGNADMGTEGDVLQLNGKSYTVTAYGTAAWGNWWADGHMAFALNTYDDGERNTFFAPRPTATFETEGSSYGGGLATGYTLQFGGLGVGPEVGLRYAYTKLDPFAEAGAGSLGLSVERFDAESLLGNAGIQMSSRIEGDGTAIIPTLRLSWEHEFLNDDRVVNARLPGGQVGSVNAGAGDRDRLVGGIGVAFQSSGLLFGSLGWERVISGGHGDDQVFVARIRAGF